MIIKIDSFRIQNCTRIVVGQLLNDNSTIGNQALRYALESSVLLRFLYCKELINSDQVVKTIIFTSIYTRRLCICTLIFFKFNLFLCSNCRTKLYFDSDFNFEIGVNLNYFISIYFKDFLRDYSYKIHLNTAYINKFKYLHYLF